MVTVQLRPVIAVLVAIQNADTSKRIAIATKILAGPAARDSPLRGRAKESLHLFQGWLA